MRLSDVLKHQVVKVTHLTGTLILASPDCLSARKDGVIGRVESIVPEDSDELALIWVRHGGKVVPYRCYELALVGTTPT